MWVRRGIWTLKQINKTSPQLRAAKKVNPIAIIQFKVLKGKYRERSLMSPIALLGKAVFSLMCF